MAIEEDVTVRAKAQHVIQRVRTVVRDSKRTYMSPLRIGPRSREEPRAADLAGVVIKPLDGRCNVIVAYDPADVGTAPCWRNVLTTGQCLCYLSGDETVPCNGPELVNQNFPSVTRSPAPGRHREEPQIDVFAIGFPAREHRFPDQDSNWSAELEVLDQSEVALLQFLVGNMTSGIRVAPP